MVEYVIDVMTAFAMCNDPQMSYDAARAQVTDMVTTWNGETYSKVIDTGNYKMTMESKQRTGVFFDVLYTDEMWSDPGKKENYLPIDYELVSDYKTNCGMFFEMTGTVEKYQHADYFLDDARVWIKAEDGHTYELKYMYALAPVTFKPGEKYHFYTCLESAQHEDDTKPIILSIRYCEPIK